MPIDLTVPEHGYTQVKIVMLRVDLQRSMIFLTFTHGDTVDGVFVPGSIIPEERLIRNRAQVLDGNGEEITPEDPAYKTLYEDATSSSADSMLPADGGHRIRAAASRAFYEYAIAQGWYAGEVA